MADEISQTIHASCVSIDGYGLLIVGASGSGKSSLCLQLMGLGFDLVADDQTSITRNQTQLICTAPSSIQGLIEARGVGILEVPVVSNTVAKAVVDLNQLELERLPSPRAMDVLGLLIPCLHKVDSPSFPAALLHYVRYGRQDIE